MLLSQQRVLPFHIIGLPNFNLSIIISFAFFTTLYLETLSFIYIGREYITFCVMWHSRYNSLALWWYIGYKMHTSENPAHCAAFSSDYNLAFLKLCLHVLWFTSVASFWYVLFGWNNKHFVTYLHDFLSFIALQKSIAARHKTYTDMFNKKCEWKKV